MTRLLMLAIASMFALSACNTMSGLGQDIEAGGNKLENAAEKGKRSNYPHPSPPLVAAPSGAALFRESENLPGPQGRRGPVSLAGANAFRTGPTSGKPRRIRVFPASGRTGSMPEPGTGMALA